MKILTYFLTFFLFFSPISAKEFRIDFADEGMKALKKKGFGKKTIYTNGKDDKGYYLKAVADSGATGLGVEIKNKDGWITIPAKELTVISGISGNPEWLPAKRFRRPSEYRVFSLPQNIFLEGTERENLSINIIVKAITDDKAHKHPIAYSYFSPITSELND